MDPLPIRQNMGGLFLMLLTILYFIFTSVFYIPFNILVIMDLKTINETENKQTKAEYWYFRELVFMMWKI